VQSLRNRCAIDTQSLRNRCAIVAQSPRKRCGVALQSLHNQSAIDAQSLCSPTQHHITSYYITSLLKPQHTTQHNRAAMLWGGPEAASAASTVIDTSPAGAAKLQKRFNGVNPYVLTFRGNALARLDNMGEQIYLEAFHLTISLTILFSSQTRLPFFFSNPMINFVVVAISFQPALFPPRVSFYTLYFLRFLHYLFSFPDKALIDYQAASDTFIQMRDIARFSDARANYALALYQLAASDKVKSEIFNTIYCAFCLILL
jgi:hypothetical protein